MRRLPVTVLALAALAPAALAQDEPERISRKHARKPTAEYEHLQRRFESDTDWGSRVLSAERAAEDLDELEWQLVHRHSYRDLTGVDLEAALDTLRLGLGDGISCGAFAVQVQKLFALLGDAHTRVIESTSSMWPGGAADFLFGDAALGIVAFEGDRSEFLDPDHPFLVSMDGVPIERWIEAAGATEARGSPQLIRNRSVRNLRYLGRVRQELGLPAADTLTVVLRDAEGSTATREQPVVERREAYGTWPDGDSRVLAGNVGYLRLADMGRGEEFRADLLDALELVRDTRALVLDVRSNGGGSREALLTLLPSFVDPKSGPFVANVAFYRLPPGRDERADGHMENRFLWPTTASHWAKDERKLLTRFSKRWKPAWKLPKGRFSRPHFMLVAPTDSGVHYHDRPVCVLVDSYCFSATDIFCGAFAELPNVTLIGAPSAGGSGRTRELKLRHSRIDYRVSSMASFRPNGQLYDGRGIEVDVPVKTVATDFIGETDTVLDAALERLR